MWPPVEARLVGGGVLPIAALPNNTKGLNAVPCSRLALRTGTFITSFPLVPWLTNAGRKLSGGGWSSLIP